MTDLSFLPNALSAASQKIADTYCLGLLQSLVTGYPFLPITTASLRPHALVHILNDIVVNDRKNIIEFGSGLSTILIGRLIKRNALDSRILSVENDEGWAKTVSRLVRNEGIEDAIDVVHAPLVETGLALDGNLWYDVSVLDDRIAGRQFDMAIIDGPNAWQKGHEKARYPTLPYIYGKLNCGFCVYLDDANRPGENSIIQLWEKKYGTEFSKVGDTLAYCKTGGVFHSAAV